MIRFGNVLAAVCAAALFWVPATRADTPGYDFGRWPQAHSDIPADATVRFGTLPNGMRYAIMHNATPPGQVAVRLYINAGSLMEADDQQGLAHFMEHMAFNGSTHVPEGEMVHRLERLGLAFGADTNAYTATDQTVYQLDLPNNRADTMATAMTILRDAAGEAAISAAAVERERGVVLSEERASGGPADRMNRAATAFLYQGLRLPSRFPIGQVAVISHAPRQRIVDFYRAWYRPENAVLIVVGDVDLATMEADIRQRFSDWRGVGPAGVAPDMGRVAQRTQQTSVFVEPGVQTGLILNWLSPPMPPTDSRRLMVAANVRGAGLAILNYRLARLSEADDAPWTSAGASFSNDRSSARVTTVSVSVRPGRWADAITRAEQEVRRIVRFGVRPDEVQRYITERRTAMQQHVAQTTTTPSPALADIFVANVHDGDITTSNQTDAELLEEAIPHLTPEAIQAALADSFSGSGPLLFASSPTPIEGGQAALDAALTASIRVAVTAPTAQAALTWPYTNFGAPGRVVERREVADMGLTFIRFANGVRLTVRPSTVTANQVLTSVRFGHGVSTVPGDQPNQLWSAALLADGGLGRLSAEEVNRVLADRAAGIITSVEADAFALHGVTRASDLQTEMQMAAALATDPGWRPVALERLRTRMLTTLDQLDSSDEAVFQRDAGGLLHSGDRRWVFPTREDIAGASVPGAQALVADLAHGPLDVVVVGDVTVDQAIDAVASTFGAMPPRDPERPAQVVGVRFPTPPPQPVTLLHRGRDDQAIGFVAWPTDSFYADTQRSRTVGMLAQIMQLRLDDELRERMGVTYSPQAGNEASQTFDGYGYVYAKSEVPPGQLDAYFAAVRRIAANLRDHPPTADEMSRALNPQLEALQRARQTNVFWVSSLGAAQTDPRVLERLRSTEAALRRITAADIQAVARLYLTDARAYRIIVRPGPGAAPAAGPTPAR